MKVNTKVTKNNENFYCEKCNYTTSKKGDYNKHLSTLKHQTSENLATLSIISRNKKSHEFNCNICNYTTSKKTDYDKHLITLKHKVNIENNDTIKKSPNKICDCCSKEFNSYNSLWKHKNKYNCNKTEIDNNNSEKTNIIQPDEKNNIITSEMVVDIIKQSKELQNVLIEQNKQLQNKLLELASKPQSIINNNNTTNQQFNLQLYLNETCKDAMNIADFVNSLQLTTDDFETTGKLGFIDGISRIFIKELKKLDTEKLPIHCTDFKRETVYIKDNDIWEKENDEKKRVKWAIDKIAKLNYNQIQQWQEKFPECRENNTPANEYFFRLVKVALGGYGKEEEEKFSEKIMRNVLKEVVLDKKQRTIHSA